MRSWYNLTVTTIIVLLGRDVASAESSQIVFVSDRGGNPDLFVMAGDGMHLRHLTQTPFEEDVPALSPQGARVAYVSRKHGMAQSCLVAG